MWLVAHTEYSCRPGPGVRDRYAHPSSPATTLSPQDSVQRRVRRRYHAIPGGPQLRDGSVRPLLLLVIIVVPWTAHRLPRTLPQDQLPVTSPSLPATSRPCLAEVSVPIDLTGIHWPEIPTNPTYVYHMIRVRGALCLRSIGRPLILSSIPT